MMHVLSIEPQTFMGIGVALFAAAAVMAALGMVSCVTLEEFDEASADIWEAWQEYEGEREETVDWTMSQWERTRRALEAWHGAENGENGA